MPTLNIFLEIHQAFAGMRYGSLSASILPGAPVDTITTIHDFLFLFWPFLQRCDVAYPSASKIVLELHLPSAYVSEVTPKAQI